MATGKEIETRGHIVGFQEEISKVAGQGKEEFFTWFDSVSNTDMAFIRGNWDFLYHIALPIAQYIKNPEDKSVLDIGYGGGRMLTSACSFFKNGIGIDIHDQVELVTAEMKTRGVLNFSLMQTDGKNIPIQEKHIDLVYSFIVLMHVEKIEIFKSYFFETYRVLKPGGVAILYFARQYSLSNNKKSKLI